MKRIVWETAVCVAVMIAGILSLSGCASSSPGEKASEDLIPVRVLPVYDTHGIDTKSYVGTVAPVKSTLLSCKYPGTLVSLAVRQGDFVNKGDVVAVVESQTVISAREIARATLKQAEDGYDRVTRVHSSGSIADVKMVEIETQLAKARAAAVSAEKAYEECTVRAPFSGVIGNVFVSEGVDVDPVENIVRLLDISELEIHISVPENEVGSLYTGMSARMVIPALNRKSMIAKVVSKGIVASPLSHSYDCTLSPDGCVDGLMPGMVCKVYLENESKSGYIVPSSVVRTDVSGRYVWVVDDGIVDRAYVSIDGFSGNGVVVTSGLDDGDLIIVEGGQKVCTGMKVRTIMSE